MDSMVVVFARNPDQIKSLQIGPRVASPKEWGWSLTLPNLDWWLCEYSQSPSRKKSKSKN